MSEFRVGDRVRLAVKVGSRTKGTQGEVAEVSPVEKVWPIAVRFDGETETEIYAVKELELIQPQTPPLRSWHETGPLVLDPTDPFEKVLIEIVETNRRKRKDYALDGSPFSNFDDTAAGLGIEGFTAAESAVFNMLQKLARLKSLRANGRMDDPANEAVIDTRLDLAVYGVIQLAISRYPDGKVPA